MLEALRPRNAINFFYEKEEFRFIFVVKGLIHTGYIQTHSENFDVSNVGRWKPTILPFLVYRVKFVREVPSKASNKLFDGISDFIIIVEF